MHKKQQAKQHQIMEKQSKNGISLSWYDYRFHREIIRAAIDNDYKYIIICYHENTDRHFNAIVKDDARLITELLKLSNKGISYRFYKIRRRARKFNSAKIS